MIVGRVKLTDKKPPEGKQVIFFSNGDEERPCYGVYKVDKGFEYVVILDSSGEEDYYNLSDYSEWLDESTPAEDWVKDKPVITEPCMLLTASYFDRHGWLYDCFQIKRLSGENDKGEPSYYLAVLQNGEEWGDINDLHADLYKVLPLLPSPPKK